MFLRKFLGKFVSYVVMPSQSIPPQNAFPENGDTRILLEDGSKIDFWTHAESEQPEKLIIHAVGNADTYEHHIEEYEAEAKEFPNACIVAFNFRNVSNSTGSTCSEEDWIKDALGVINHFRGQGFQSENILLVGHSLGAAILTLAAAKDYENRGRQGCVRVLNNRTFSDLPTEIAEGILGKQGSFFLICLGLLPFLGVMPTLYTAIGLAAVESFSPFSICKKAMKATLKPILWATFGTMDVATAYRVLPPEAKDYVMAKNDRVIPPSASLHAAFSKAERRQEKNAALNEVELLIIKDRKLASTRRVDAHNDALSVLFTNHKKRSIPQRRATEEGGLPADPRPPHVNGKEVMINKTRRLLGI